MDLVDVLLEVLERDASDLHLTVGSPPIIRINGALERLDYPRLSANDTRELIYSILSQDQRQRLENEWEIDFSLLGPRARALPRQRLLPAQQPGRGLPPHPHQHQEARGPRPAAGAARPHAQAARLRASSPGRPARASRTTLAAMIDEINETRDEHIMTIEDPIEFLHRHKKCMVNQREVGADTKSFNRALKSVLRQDPDIILVGEMRDTETMATALTAAETGHLVFATLHTQDAPQTIDRIIDVFPPHQQEQIRVQLSHDAHGRLHAAAAADARRPRPLRRLRAAHPDARGPQPHPRGQDAPDLLDHADRHARSACRPWTRRSPTWCAAASSRASWPSTARARPRSSSGCWASRRPRPPAAEGCRNRGSGR